MQRVHAVLVIAIVSGSSVAGAGDWPQWRGPDHDGVSRNAGVKLDWAEALPLVWEQQLGSGFSGFSVVGERVYTGGTRNGQQTAICLDRQSGKILWESPIEREYREPQGGDGLRSTPTVNDGRVYMFGARGRLVCLSADSGSLIWDAKFNEPPRWGYSGSVLVEGDVAILSPGSTDGGLLALDKRTGAKRWSAGSDLAGYATPYPFDLSGTRYVLGFLGGSAIIARAADGAIVWERSWETDYNVNAATPIFHTGRLLLSSGYQSHAGVFELTATGESIRATELWSKDTLQNKFQTPVLHDGFLYTGDQRGLKCVDFATGEIRWQARRISDLGVTPPDRDSDFMHSTTVIADGGLLVLTQHGELLMGVASPDGFTPTTVAKILGGRCWTVPTVLDGRIYARDLTRGVCFDLRPR